MLHRFDYTGKSLYSDEEDYCYDVWAEFTYVRGGIGDTDVINGYKEYWFLDDIAIEICNENGEDITLEIEEKLPSLYDAIYNEAEDIGTDLDPDCD